MARKIIRTVIVQLLILGAMLSGTSVLAGGKTWYADFTAGEGAVSFDAIGKPAMLRIHGEGGAPRGLLKVEDGNVTGSCSFDLNTLDTGIKLRNRHMREKYLDTAKHPSATFAFTKLRLPRGFGNSVKTVERLPFEGMLTLHGAQKAVSGMADLTVDYVTVFVDAEFETKVSDYQIEAPSFAGVTLADVVKVRVKFKAKAKDRP